jgi:hypothetical protein
MRATVEEGEVGVAVQLDVWVHVRACMPMLLAWAIGGKPRGAAFAARVRTRFGSSSPARAFLSVTAALSFATRSFARMGPPRQDRPVTVRPHPSGPVPAGSATSFGRTATRGSQATNLGDCGPRDRRATVVHGPEGYERGIWHQPQGRSRRQRGDPLGSFLFLRCRSDRCIRPYCFAGARQWRV